MLRLIAATFIWALSFSLIGHFLSGQISTGFSVLSRMGLAFICFLPFIRYQGVPRRHILLFLGIGAIQIGVMYLFYYASFAYLSVPEILLFTIFTPLYVSLIYQLLTLKRIRISHFITIALAILGAGIIRYNPLTSDFLIGFLFIQAANLCFAFGQVIYKYQFRKQPFSQTMAFSWIYLGAFLVTALYFFIFEHDHAFPTQASQWWALLWLGVVASGIGYFLWNSGGTQVNSGILAMMNNAVIPVGILINVLFFNTEISIGRFMIGSALIVLTLWYHQRHLQSSNQCTNEEH